MSSLCLRLAGQQHNSSKKNYRQRYKKKKAKSDKNNRLNRLKMSGKAGGKGSLAKNLKKMK